MYVLMDQQKIDMYLMTNAKYFEGSSIPMLRDNLLKFNIGLTTAKICSIHCTK